MPSKTDRILSYLPSTLRALPRPTAIYALVDAFGNELQQADNSLAENLLAHWVDHADRNAETIQDLACIAALYGLVPRGALKTDGDQTGACPAMPADEAIEEFREHLKRYIRTFLEGTVTVQGVLRVVAEALGLEIADNYADLDLWWKRKEDVLTTTEPDGEDASHMLVGSGPMIAAGRAAQPARVMGTRDLSGLIDLTGASYLRVKVDDSPPVTINLAASLDDPGAATLDQITKVINDSITTLSASRDGHQLVLSARRFGSTSRIELIDIEEDAAPLLLGRLPTTYKGEAAKAAEVTGLEDLSSGVNLAGTPDRYLRLLVDGRHLAEIDCAGANPAHTSIDEVVKAINDALEINVASNDGGRLKLVSPKIGFDSRIALLAAAAQDARNLLFGPVGTFYMGKDAHPARVIGTPDLSTGVDLSERSRMRVRIDGRPAVTIDCAGATPAQTQLDEIVRAVNDALGVKTASHDGRVLRLTSNQAGSTGLIVLESLPRDENAADLILGILPRVFAGAEASRARLIGNAEPGARGDASHPTFDVMSRHLLQVAIDYRLPVKIDLRAAVINPRIATLDQLVAAINAAMGQEVASRDNNQLALTSPTTGASSRVEVGVLEVVRRRRFVTRAFVANEAARAIFGFFSAKAEGRQGTQARITGTLDLSRGVDLSTERFLRIGVDDAAPVDVDCAANSPRPRVALLDEITRSINAALNQTIAAHDGQVLTLDSPTEGETSRLVFEPARSRDTMGKLLGIAPTIIRGRGATGIRFVGTPDLREGVDLSTANHIKLGVDGREPVEITITGANLARVTLQEIIVAISLTPGAPVASLDDGRVILNTSTSGENSELRFEVPEGPDATKLIFGITAPRHYRGTGASPARIVGKPDLKNGANLEVARFLRLAIDGRPPADVDCATIATDPAMTSLENIVDAINRQISPEFATSDGAHLILTSPSTGVFSVIELLPFSADDARKKLFGNVPAITPGNAPLPATIISEGKHIAPLNLAERGTLRLVVNGTRADIDVRGAAPQTTLLNEIIRKLNAAFPGIASATEDKQLKLVSPIAGEESRIEILPLRVLEIIEYPPEMAEWTPDNLTGSVPNGPEPYVWSIENDSTTDGLIEIELTAPFGTVGPLLLNRTTGRGIRLRSMISAGEKIRISAAEDGNVRAEIIGPDGRQRFIDGSLIITGSLGDQVAVPYKNERALTRDNDGAEALQLNNPEAPAVVTLRARTGGETPIKTSVVVVAAELTGDAANPEIVQGQATRLIGRARVKDGGSALVNQAGATIIRLRPLPGISLQGYNDRIIAASGTIQSEEGALVMIVARVARLFDVIVRGDFDESKSSKDTYTCVEIGLGQNDPNGLTWQVNVGLASQAAPGGSRLVIASEMKKGDALIMPSGHSEWTYVEGEGARFAVACFDHSRFIDADYNEQGRFNISRFSDARNKSGSAIFSLAGAEFINQIKLRFRWTRHRRGAFVVNLPSILPEEFGSRFDQTRFSRKDDEPELFNNIVAEPPVDNDHLVTTVNQNSKLVEASVIDRLPPGARASVMPFRRPRSLALTGGSESEAARLYLSVKDVPGFIELRARDKGQWGNTITVTARKANPGRFDVTISYRGARFEKARATALGEPTPALAEKFRQPGLIGVLQAKAAGIQVYITRDGADTTPAALANEPALKPF